MKSEHASAIRDEARHRSDIGGTPSSRERRHEISCRTAPSVASAGIAPIQRKWLVLMPYFGAGGGHSDHFLRAQVGRQECQPANPRWNGPARQKKIRAGLHPAPEPESQ